MAPSRIVATPVSSRDAEFDRRLVLAFGPLTPAELRRELDLLAAQAGIRQRVVDACEGRPTLAIGSAYYGFDGDRLAVTR